MDLPRYDDGHRDDGHGDDRGTGESVGEGTHSGSSTENDDVSKSDYAGAGSSARIRNQDISHDDNDPSNVLSGSGTSSASATNMAEFRREKRLAMNRASARNRRKRKKMLIETLEQQNSEISRDNRSLKLVRESLATKVRSLEQELSAARATIAQFQLAAATQLPNQTLPTAHFSAASASIPQQLAFGGVGFASQLNSLSAAAVGDQPNTVQAEHVRHSATNQLDPFGLQQARPPQSNLQFASALKNANPSSHHLSDDPILRRHAADMQALSQASRDSALGSIANPQHLLRDNPLQRSIALQSTFPGIRSESEQTSQQQSPFLGMGDLPIQQNVRLPDAWLQSQMSLRGDEINITQQRFLEELLRQRGNEDSSSSKPEPKFPPSES